MSYKDLYEYCQGQAQIPLSTSVITSKISRILPNEPFKVVQSGLESSVIRGYFVPSTNTHHQFVRQTGGGNVVVIARDVSEEWKRFVKIKELMHLFDKPLEIVNAKADLDTLLNDFFGSQNPNDKKSPFYNSEAKAFWMALALFCQESKRTSYILERSAGNKTNMQIANELRLPEFCINFLLHEDFKKILTDILACD